MAKCPECGTEVDQTAKWIIEGKTDSNEERARLEIGMFNCQMCLKPFKKVLRRTRVDRTGAHLIKICGFLMQTKAYLFWRKV